MNINYDSPFNFKPIPSITPASDYWQNSTWKFNMPEISAGATYQPSWIDVILHGNTALTLVNAKADSLEYLKLFGGTEQLPSTYLDTVTLSGGCEQRNLPSGYTELQSISGNTMSACIDTGVAGNNDNLRFKFTASKSEFAAYTSLIGNYYDENSNTTRIIAGAKSNSGVIAEINRKAANSNITNTVDITAEHEYELYKESGISVLKVDGVIVEQMADSSGTDNSRTIAINSSNVRTTASVTTVTTTFKGHFYIWNGTTLIREYVPAKRNSDNKVGFYDLVNDTFNPSMFDDYQFTAGADVVPTPDTPMDIVCNNGVIKGNKLLPLGTKISAWISSTNKWVVVADSASVCIPVKVGETYTLKWNNTDSNAVGTIFRYGFSDTSTPNEQILSQPNRTTPQDNPSVKVTADKAYLVIQILNAVFDTIVNNNYFSVIEDSIYTEGTVETVTDSNGLTASAERLLAVGTYKDTQEVIAGSVTRNVGVLVLDGTETWDRSGSGYFYNSVSNIKSGVSDTDTIKCSHFKQGTKNSPMEGEISFRLNLNGFILNWDTNATLTQWTQFLAQQYANGTPVIIVYPLATATTESVSGQLLQKSPVTQTAGSISNLPISITESQKTVPTPQRPLQINCNNGVVKTNTNILDTTNIYGNYLLTDSGQVGSASSSWYLTNFIKVKPSTRYTLSFVSGASTQYRRIAEYTSSNQDTFVQLALKGFTTTSEFTTSSTTNYIRVSARIEDTQNVIRLTAYALNEIYTDGTTETVEIDTTGNTATAENLFKVGTYQDVQSVINGGVTRNVGIKVLDGTEAGTWAIVNNAVCRKTIAEVGMADSKLGTADAYSNYFIGSSFTPAQSINNGMFITSTGLFGFSISDIGTTDSAIDAWLAERYASGNPVIVVYPTSSPTTETVTPQPMNIQAGTNIVEITQASMDNLELEVSYKAGVAVTITEIENAQLDNNVEVTIQ